MKKPDWYKDFEGSTVRVEHPITYGMLFKVVGWGTPSGSKEFLLETPVGHALYCSNIFNEQGGGTYEAIKTGIENFSYCRNS